MNYEEPFAGCMYALLIGAFLWVCIFACAVAFWAVLT